MRIATTDSSGAFAIGELPVGQHVLTVLRIGYERLSDTVNIRAHHGVRAQLALTPSYADRCMVVVEVRTRLPWWHFW
jgi:lysozyme family protein